MNKGKYKTIGDKLVITLITFINIKKSNKIAVNIHNHFELKVGFRMTLKLAYCFRCYVDCFKSWQPNWPDYFLQYENVVKDYIE